MRQQYVVQTELAVFVDSGRMSLSHRFDSPIHDPTLDVDVAFAIVTDAVTLTCEICPCGEAAFCRVLRALDRELARSRWRRAAAEALPVTL